MSGTLLAGLFFVSMLITGERVTKVDFLIGMSPSVMGGLVALAVALLGLSFALQVSRRPVKTGRSRRVRTP